MSQQAPDYNATGRHWRVDFSLALYNRSGKYQIGHEILSDNRDLVDSIWYWRVAAKETPSGLRAKLIGKAEQVERALHVKLGNDRPGKGAGSHRWLHLDPLTVCHRRPNAGDIVLVHDLGPLTHPGLFAPGTGRAYDLAYSILSKSAAMPVFVSKDTARRYAQMYGEPVQSQVIYPPIAPRMHEGARDRPANVGDRFLLTVGAIGTRKNQLASIRAFAESGLAAKGIEYVMCGSREPGYAAVAELASKTSGVRMLSFVSDAELRWLYANASGFVLASLLEGFGMPVAEAMAFGLVPIVSGDSVLEEVVGDAGLIVAPEQTGQIAAAMHRALLMDDAERRERERQMQVQLAQFQHDSFRSAWTDLLARPLV